MFLFIRFFVGIFGTSIIFTKCWNKDNKFTFSALFSPKLNYFWTFSIYIILEIPHRWILLIYLHFKSGENLYLILSKRREDLQNIFLVFLLHFILFLFEGKINHYEFWGGFQNFFSSQFFYDFLFKEGWANGLNITSNIPKIL